MGLFGKKEVCAICGGKLKALGATQIAGGKICTSCREKCTQYITMPERYNAVEISDNMNDAKINKDLYQIFAPTSYPYMLQVDFQNKLFSIASDKFLKLQKGYIFRFDELVDYSVFQDGNTIQKSGVGSALVGGILFGGVGAIAGGLMGHKSKETITKMYATLKTTNKWAPEVRIGILDAEVKKGTSTYKFVQDQSQKLFQALDMIMQK